MELTGRLTRDAEVKSTKNDKKVVAFTVVVNDYYKSKDNDEREFEEFFNCSYWFNTKIADSLQKGCIVTVSGRVYLNEYKGKDGNQHANLAVHANAIKIIATAKRKEAAQQADKAEPAPAGASETKEDLPF